MPDFPVSGNRVFSVIAIGELIKLAHRVGRYHGKGADHSISEDYPDCPAAHVVSRRLHLFHARTGMELLLRSLTTLVEPQLPGKRAALFKDHFDPLSSGPTFSGRLIGLELGEDVGIGVGALKILVHRKLVIVKPAEEALPLRSDIRREVREQ